MAFEMKQVSNPKWDRLMKKTIQEYGNFFGFKWTQNAPFLVKLPDRKTIDLIRGIKTKSWVIGFSSGNTVYVLSDKNLEAESNHLYSDKLYTELIRHEIVHCFTEVVSGVRYLEPNWLNEGLSLFLSGQIKTWPHPKEFRRFIDCYMYSEGVYKEAGFAVEFLVKKYGRKKMITLLKRCNEAKTKEKFAKLFKSIYGFALAYKNFRVL